MSMSIKTVLKAVPVLAGVLLFTCDQMSNPISGTQKIEYTQGNSAANAYVKIKDSRIGTPIQGAIVTVTGVAICTTATDGIAEFKALLIGDYPMTVNKSGYEGMSSILTIRADSASSATPRALQTSIECSLSKKGVVICGQVFYRIKDNLYPVVLETVELQFPESNRFCKPFRSVKTLPDGYFFFDSIPENVRASVSVKKHNAGGIYYAQNSAVLTQLGYAGDTIVCSPIIMTPADNGYFTIVSDNADSIADTIPFRVYFSEPVDTTKLNFDSVYVYEGTSSNRILIVTQWKSGGAILELLPYRATWKNGSGYTVYIGIITSKTGAILYNSSSYRQFAIVKSGNPGNVTNFKVYSPLKPDYSTTSVTLQWAPLSNATRYELYGRVQGDSLWKMYAPSSSVSDTVRSVYIGSVLSAGKYIEMFVLGINNGKRSEIANAAILKISDTYRPVLTGSSTATTMYNCNNTTSTSSTVRFPSTIRFSEPMDTTVHPSVTVKEGSYGIYGDSTFVLSADSVHSIWTSSTQMQLEAVIPPAKNASHDSVFVNFSLLTDLAGNKVALNDMLTIPVLKYVTRP